MTPQSTFYGGIVRWHCCKCHMTVYLPVTLVNTANAFQ